MMQQESVAQLYPYFWLVVLVSVVAALVIAVIDTRTSRRPRRAALRTKEPIGRPVPQP